MFGTKSCFEGSLWMRNCCHPKAECIVVMIRKLAILLVACAVLRSSALTQDLIVNVNLRMLDVVVQDIQGRPVLDLTRDDFEVIDNNQVIPASDVSLMTEPMAVGFVVDRSSSVEPVRKGMNQALALLFEGLRPADQTFMITFAGGLKLNVADATGRSKLLDVARKTKLGFGTRLYDTLSASIQYLSESPLERKILIVFSDGADHFSEATFGQVVEEAKRYGYPVFVLVYKGEDPLIWSRDSRLQINRQLEKLAAMTGGKAYFPSEGTDCPEVTPILDGLRYTYRVEYYAPELVTTSSLVRVQVRRNRSENLTVRTLWPMRQSEYWADPQQ
jgi:VWFA-related protein